MGEKFRKPPTKYYPVPPVEAAAFTKLRIEDQISPVGAGGC